MKGLLPPVCRNPCAALTAGSKHHILCLIAVSGTKAGPKRESGANPELPRSGKWERTMPLALNLRRKSTVREAACNRNRLEVRPNARESEDLPRSSSRKGCCSALELSWEERPGCSRSRTFSVTSFRRCSPPAPCCAGFRPRKHDNDYTTAF